MQEEKKEGIDLDEVPSFPSTPQTNDIPVPRKPLSGGLFSKMKNVFSKRSSEAPIESPFPLPPSMPEEGDPYQLEMAPGNKEEQIKEIADLPTSAPFDSPDDFPSAPFDSPEEFPSDNPALKESPEDMPPLPEAVQDIDKTKEVNTPPKVSLEKPEEPIVASMPIPVPDTKKKEYLGQLRSEFTQRIKDINKTPIRNKQMGQLAEEITSHRHTLDELNKELHKINSELSKLNI